MRVSVNGEGREVAEATSVAELLRALSLEGCRVVVECNGEVVERRDHATRLLCPGDRLEIVRFVGGG